MNSERRASYKSLKILTSKIRNVSITSGISHCMRKKKKNGLYKRERGKKKKVCITYINKSIERITSYSVISTTKKKEYVYI
jgi:hypothetical protein